jgi:hypothetical protein
MLESIKRLFGGGVSQAGWGDAERWASEQGHVFKRARDGGGFVIEARDWRLEWGPSQRDYLPGAELRLRAELGGAPNLQMLVVSRLLMEALERQVFEEFIEGTQTRIDTATPEEMRWLVLFPKLATAGSKALREHYGAVANVPEALAQWLEGDLAQALLDARGWLADDDRLVLVVQRGRLTLRTAMARPQPARFAPLAALFEAALRQARPVARQFH